MLPYVMEYYWEDGNAKFRDIAVAFDEDVNGITDREAGWQAIVAINKLKKDVGIPDTLSDVNIGSENLENIVKDAASYRLLPNSPRHLTIEDLRIIVTRALGKS